jgi:hypothetical protein
MADFILVHHNQVTDIFTRIFFSECSSKNVGVAGYAEDF